MEVPGFESRSGHLSHCIFPVIREFTHGCSRSSQPSHHFAGRQNDEKLSAVATTDTFTRFTVPEPGKLQHLSNGYMCNYCMQFLHARIAAPCKNCR